MSLRLHVFFLILFFSSCSSTASEDLKNAKMALLKGSEIFGMQGCIFRGDSIFRGIHQGKDKLYKFESSNFDLRVVEDFSYIGSLSCEGEGVYFSATPYGGGHNLYFFDGKNTALLKENIGCSFLAGIDGNKFYCYKDEGYDGSYLIGVFDRSNGSFTSLFLSEKYGLSEGYFFALSNSIVGTFFDESSNELHLKSISLETGSVTESVVLNCDYVSIVSLSENQLVYSCGSSIGRMVLKRP
ncbi:hypothetical protein [Microbulbifer agarilyticus]|uniref:hypothetical protein n=1 Tax=Microbulbifer agarilyticus TaxID=260552 RepID=UPI001CD70DD8|nr:hypothetical protein [Microbulbifer agarilyticus]MCA0891995.1 hypothetical protein [Microbulbifer agarilyticus]